MVLPYQSHARGAGGAFQQAVPLVPQSSSNLFVKNLPFTVTDAQLAQLFAKFGPVRSIKVKYP